MKRDEQYLIISDRLTAASKAAEAAATNMLYLVGELRALSEKIVGLKK